MLFGYQLVDFGVMHGSQVVFEIIQLEVSVFLCLNYFPSQSLVVFLEVVKVFLHAGPLLAEFI